MHAFLSSCLDEEEEEDDDEGGDGDGGDERVERDAGDDAARAEQSTADAADDDDAAAWSGDALSLCARPRMALLRGFVSAAEAAALVRATAADRSCWEAQGDAHATCLLEELGPDAAARAALARVDARIGALLGVPPAHIEHGYVQRYAAGFAMHNLHLDHNPASMRPRRVASLIVYLDDQVSEPFPLRLFSQRSFLPLL